MGKIQLFALMIKLIPVIVMVIGMIKEAKEEDSPDGKKVSWTEISEIIEAFAKRIYKIMTGEEIENE